MLILEREKGESERGKHPYERETLFGCLPCVLLPGVEPTTQVMCPDWESNTQPIGGQDDGPTS